MSVTYLEPGAVIGAIIKSEMDLKDGQVMFSNSRFEIPMDGLYIAVSYVGPAKVISRMSELVPDGSGGVAELQTVTMLNIIQIDIMAYNDPKGGNQARARKEEIAMALGSIFSQQQQELYAMQIARHTGPIMDTSFLEETGMVTRYTLTIGASSVKRKQKKTDQYYSDFSNAVPPLLTVNA